jgi:hypothetical protein
VENDNESRKEALLRERYYLIKHAFWVIFGGALGGGIALVGRWWEEGRLPYDWLWYLTIPVALFSLVSAKRLFRIIGNHVELSKLK